MLYVRSLSSVMLIFSVFLCYSCSTSSQPQDMDRQQLFFYAYMSGRYWDGQNQQYVEVQNVSAGGVVIADPIPSFEYFKLGSSAFSGPQYWEEFPGYISFGDFIAGGAGYITSDYYPLNAEVRTSAGVLQGSISAPEKVNYIFANTEDSLKTGQEFKLFWNDSNADFYYIYMEYFWLDSLGYLNFTEISDFSLESSITFPDSVFKFNGQISNISVQAMNGPNPVAGTPGNMQGDGKGFLYFQIEPVLFDNPPIVVGDGFASTSTAKPGMQTIRHMQNKLHTEIVKRIIGMQN